LNHLSTQQMEMREQIAIVDNQLGKIANYIGISGDPLIGKAGLLGAIDLYAWSKKQDIPISEGILIALYLAPEQRNKLAPLNPKEAGQRRSEVAKQIPSFTVPDGRLTLMIEEKNTPVLFNYDNGRLEPLSPLDSPVTQIGFSENSTRVGVGCQDGSSIVWEIGNLKRNTKSNQPLQTALGLDDINEESRQKLLKTSSEQNVWQAGYTALGQEWLLRALSAVTRSPEDYPSDYTLRADTGRKLTQTLNEALQLAGANKVEEALSLLTEELSNLGFKTGRDTKDRTRAQLTNVLVSSALYRLMEEFENLRQRLLSGGAADLEPDFEPRHEKLILALDPQRKNTIEAQKEIHRGNVLAFQGDQEGAIKAYQRAKELDSALKNLNPEDQVKRFAGSSGPSGTAREAAIQKISLANEAAQRGEVDRASAFYREAIALDPQLAESLDPDAEARKWSKRRNAPMNMPTSGQTSQELNQIRE
jgi:tetratricopeptide (TPR) repeat protein